MINLKNRGKTPFTSLKKNKNGVVKIDLDKNLRLTVKKENISDNIILRAPHNCMNN